MLRNPQIPLPYASSTFTITAVDKRTTMSPHQNSHQTVVVDTTKADAVEIVARFEKKSAATADDDLITIAFTRDHSWLDAMQMLQDLQENLDLLEGGEKRIHWCIWPNAPIFEEVAILMIETLEYLKDASHSKDVKWEQFVFQDLDQSNVHHDRILSTVCRMELFQSLWIGGRNNQQMSQQTALDLSFAISQNSSVEEISVFLKLTDECFPILGESLQKAKNQRRLSLHLNLTDSMYEGSSPLSKEFQNGITRNKRLRHLDLDGFPIKWLCSLFQALEHSPIETLCLKKCQWKSPDADEAGAVEEEWLWNQVARYLFSKECRLQTLDVSYPSSSLNVFGLSFCLERNSSLQTLRLRHAGLVASHLMELLLLVSGSSGTKHPSMKELDLQGNSISLLELSNLVFQAQASDNDRLTILEEQTNTSQLSRINLDGNRNNHIWPEEDAKKIQKVLLWLFDRYPSLVFLGDRFARSYLSDAPVQHAIDLNLLGTRRWRRDISAMSVDPSTSATFQGALWPYMLERPTKMLPDDPNRQASVTFRLLVDGVGMMLHETD